VKDRIVLPMVRPTAPQRVLVTGAGGFVGGWVLQGLESVQLPCLEIFAGMHRGETRAPMKNPIRIDITHPTEVDHVIKEVKPTAVIHLAAISNVKEAREAPRAAFEVNLQGTMNLAESVLRHCPQTRFIFVSSSDVYGSSENAQNGKLDEAAPLDPQNTYAAAKAAADLSIGQMAHDGLKAIRLRAFNHTGPRQTERFVVPAFAAQIARIEIGAQEAVIRVGNLDACRDFLDVRDVADAYIGLALSSSSFEPGLVLNLGSGAGLRIGEILGQLISRAGTEIRIEADPARLRPKEPTFIIANPSRIQHLLGWKPQIPWAQTLTDVLAFWRGAVRNSSDPQEPFKHAKGQSS